MEMGISLPRSAVHLVPRAFCLFVASFGCPSSYVCKYLLSKTGPAFGSCRWVFDHHPMWSPSGNQTNARLMQWATVAEWLLVRLVRMDAAYQCRIRRDPEKPRWVKFYCVCCPVLASLREPSLASLCPCEPCVMDGLSFPLSLLFRRRPDGYLPTGIRPSVVSPCARGPANHPASSVTGGFSSIPVVALWPRAEPMRLQLRRAALLL